jgi:hypothetical protein
MLDHTLAARSSTAIGFRCLPSRGQVDWTFDCWAAANPNRRVTVDIITAYLLKSA